MSKKTQTVGMQLSESFPELESIQGDLLNWLDKRQKQAVNNIEQSLNAEGEFNRDFESDKKNRLVVLAEEKFQLSKEAAGFLSSNQEALSSLRYEIEKENITRRANSLIEQFERISRG